MKAKNANLTKKKKKYCWVHWHLTRMFLVQKKDDKGNRPIHI